MDKLRSDPLFEHKLNRFFIKLLFKKTLNSKQLIRDLKIRRRRRQRERHKSGRFLKRASYENKKNNKKKTTLHVQNTFLYISLRFARQRRENA